MYNNLIKQVMIAVPMKQAVTRQQENPDDGKEHIDGWFAEEMHIEQNGSKKSADTKCSFLSFLET